jgi:hypothetical protein
VKKHLQHWMVYSATLSTFAISGVALAAEPTGFLNDTGIVTCWSNTGKDTTGVEADAGSHPRQDCRYGRDAAASSGIPKVGDGGKGFDFTKIANDGTVLEETAALGTAAKDWACTRDNVTGLIWEIKTTSGLRSQSHSYTWYSSNATTNGGAVGTEGGGTCFLTGRCDTEKFASDVNTTGLCGASDWRMPSKSELFSITDLGRFNPAIDTSYFPNTPASIFWSGSALNMFTAWYVYFSYGNSVFYGKSDAHQVRLVRTGQ